jgi:hypothetical protein
MVRQPIQADLDQQGIAEEIRPDLRSTPGRAYGVIGPRSEIGRWHAAAQRTHCDIVRAEHVGGRHA